MFNSKLFVNEYLILFIHCKVSHSIPQALRGQWKKGTFFHFVIFFHFCPKDKENTFFLCKIFGRKIQFFFRVGNWKLKKKSQKIDLNSFFLFFKFSGENWKNKNSRSENFLQKNCIFSSNFLQKKIVFLCPSGKMKKQIRKWKKVPFCHFSQKAWGGHR